MSTLHGALTGADNMHVPYAWEYANQSAREAGIGVDASGIGKLARQLDDNTLWMLISASPVTWKQAGGGASFPSGTRMLFQQSTAPTGWTKDVTLNDRALRVVSGAVGSGGVTGFSSIFSRTMVDSTTLVTSQMPSHRLGILAGYSNFGGTAEAVGVGFYWSGSSDVPPASSSKFVRNATRYTDYVGGNGSHSHGLDLRLAYVDVIIARKD
ncbi:hypothetical protein [Nitratidesulfovibrio vulgaris]|nr:hypothetical protein [Nitratidesulfovibrio vulgaris]ADP86960.1 hypothetical protein Deval_1809 [Nitratidesulfovibrio vulgaris RCH1]WCB45031.1 hypothetical protein PH214_07965 [Nitratidesulfovibrio vulgaris]